MPRWEKGKRERETEANHLALAERGLEQGSRVRMVNRSSPNQHFRIAHITPNGRVRLIGQNDAQYTVRPIQVERAYVK